MPEPMRGPCLMGRAIRQDSKLNFTKDLLAVCKAVGSRVGPAFVADTILVYAGLTAGRGSGHDFTLTATHPVVFQVRAAWGNPR